MPGHLMPEERLDVLRASDGERKWYSIDDKRVCAVCNRIFTGRQIEITKNGHGKYVLHCPTTECPSSIGHWFLCEVSPARYSGNGHISRFAE